jgi:hypothetical protein
VFGKRKDNAPVHVDVIGVGASVYDQLKLNGVHTIALNSSEKSEKTDKSKSLSFRNKRAELWWMLREALDPESGDNLSLPPSDKLKADLCVPRWKMSAGGIQIESKEDIYKRIQRSTNDGDAVVYANEKTRKRDMRIGPSQARVDFDVFA